MRMGHWITGLALAAASCGAQAAAIGITNASFELDPADPGTFPVGAPPTGWSLFDPAGIMSDANNAVGILNPGPPGATTFFADGAPDGEKVALIFLGGLDGGVVGITQTLGATLQANTAYRLDVEVGNIASGTGLGSAAGFGFFDLDGFPGYRIELRAGGSLLVADDNSLAGSLAEGTFETSTMVFASGNAHMALGQALEIRLINLNIAGTLDEPGIEVDFDHLRLDASPIPLPPALGLLAAALAGLVVLSRSPVPPSS